jgi:acetyl-CoA carboxylase biotin carboxyl carrier protein
MDLTNEDVADILALLDSLPYDELDLQTTRFRLTLRRSVDGWTQSAQVPTQAGVTDGEGEAELVAGSGACASQAPHSGAGESQAPVNDGEAGAGSGAGEVGEAEGDDGEDEVGEGELVAVRAPLPGTFYRAPRPGAAPFVEVGSRVRADTMVGIVETMKLMNSVHAGADGTVAEICLGNGEFAAHEATLMWIRALS